MVDSMLTEQIALYAQQVIHAPMASIRLCVLQELIPSEDHPYAQLAPQVTFTFVIPF